MVPRTFTSRNIGLSMGLKSTLPAGNVMMDTVGETCLWLHDLDNATSASGTVYTPYTDHLIVPQHSQIPAKPLS
jgi:hypothetical protein